MIAYSRPLFVTNKLAPVNTLAIVLQGRITRRFQSSWVGPAAAASEEKHVLASSTTTEIKAQSCSPLKRLSNWHLMRNIILSIFLTTPVLYRPGFFVVRAIANSKSALLNPDRNILLRAFLKPVLYDHFCAGTNTREIKGTISAVKALGFSGVALVYNREIQITKDHGFAGVQDARLTEIAQWRDDTLKSLDMLDSGNFLGMKLTGAGQEVTQALLEGREPPPAFVSAMQAICRKTEERGCRIWIDAEQQAVQPTIDKWAIQLMRENNQGTHVVLYNTIQAYLKESRRKLLHQLELSRREGWSMGVKLVRGAYMGNDQRDLIHDTKAETDASYDGIVRDLLSGSFESIPKTSFPHMRLFLAGHNSDTVRKAMALAQELTSKGELKVIPEFGQLQGMADDIGGEIVQFGEDALAKGIRSSSLAEPTGQVYVPKVYKALHWGSVQESMQYLVRRAIENSAAADRMTETANASRKELMARMKTRLFGS